MSSNIYLGFLIVVLFLAKNIMTYYGIQAFYVYFIYLSISMSLIILNKRCIARKNKKIGILILIMAFLGILKMLSIGRGFSGLWIVETILCAPIIIGCFPTFTQKPKFWNGSLKVLLFFYIVECGVAIFERITQTNIFPWMSDDTNTLLLGAFEDVTSFRSFGLLGHPLQNALPVCTMMAFILCFTKLKGKTKVFLWVLGYLAILCFNTRSSMVGAALILLAYVLKEYFTNRKMSISKRNSILLGTVIGSIAFVAFIVQFNLGGRLLEFGLFDDTSAQVRLDTWSLFDYFDLSSFLFGFDENQKNLILYTAGLVTTENFWIDFMFSFGLIELILMILAYVMVIKSLYHGYKTFDVLITLASFLLIASTNNSLSDSWVPLFIYLLMLCVFSFKENINNPYLR